MPDHILLLILRTNSSLRQFYNLELLASSVQFVRKISYLISCPLVTSTVPRPNTALFMSPASQQRPTTSQGLENFPPVSNAKLNETYAGDKLSRPIRIDHDRKNMPSQTREKIDMTLSGDRMEIYQPTKVSVNTMRSENWMQYNNYLPVARGYNTEYPMFNNSRDGSRGFEDLYRHDPNGITLKKSPVMKKRQNLAIKRPHSAQKANFKAINADMSASAKRDFISPKTVVNNGGFASSSRFKF